MTTNKTPYCYTCKKSYDSWRELAQHYLGPGSKKHSMKARLWAKRFLLQEQAKPERVRMTEEQKTARREAKITLSGKTRTVTTLCLKGKHAVMQALPVEYVDDPTSWRIKGHLVVMCPMCRD